MGALASNALTAAARKSGRLTRGLIATQSAAAVDVRPAMRVSTPSRWSVARFATSTNRGGSDERQHARTGGQGNIRRTIDAVIAEMPDKIMGGELQAMTWFAIRTTVGAQQPQREYWAESEDENGKRVGGKKGYRIRSSTSVHESAVELALKRGGFTYYMPTEYVAVRNRRMKGVYETRRFALLKGYAFVTDLTGADWKRLEDTPGVDGFVMANGKPYPVSLLDLHRLRMYEAYSKAEAEMKAARMTTNEGRVTRKERKTASRSARRKLYPQRRVRLLWGDKVGRDATVAGWHDDEFVRVLTQELDGSLTSLTVPYEFLRAAE